MGFLKKVISILSYISYLLIGFYVVVEIPILFGYHPLIVLSGSMSPTYKVGSVVYYHQVDKEEIKEGDVITFVRNNNYVTHRVVEVGDDGLRTQGDANKVADDFVVKYEDVEGKVTKYPLLFIGYYIDFVNKHLYLLGVIVLILLSEFLLSNVEVFDINMKKGVEKNGKKE